MDFWGKLLDYNSTTQFISLQKKDDIQFELLHQLESIKEEGYKVLKVYQRKESVIILYRHFYEELPHVNETDIKLRLRIITKEGIPHPAPLLNAFFNEEFSKVELADIDIKKNLVNEGYGSILLSNLIKIVKENNARTISGWISSVDVEHIDRLVYFYRKHNFKVILNKESNTLKIGDLLWVNDSF